ncbi:chemotaxis protein CheW [Thiofilum flexile]|uniref:chemotaxis protein CheW n=1 Tax=Thiofilum flexile TaxID=125627 RepID=UPI0003639B3F|nr:chemotaxis protein CheW [Thiofilum flexile]
MSVEAVATPATRPVAPLTQFYYQVGTHALLLEPDTMAEVLLQATLSPLPFPPHWCKGLVAVRGDFYPLVDMYYILYGQTSPLKQPKLLWLKPAQSSAIVVTCDSYPKVLKFDIPPTPRSQESLLPSWVQGVVSYEAKKLLVADHRTLIQRLKQASH